MAKFLCAFAVLALLAVTADAIKCYVCPLGCTGDDKSKWNSQECGNAIPDIQKTCLKQVIQLPAGGTRVVRKCALIPAGKKYECLDAPAEKTTSCETCTSDLCNSA
ncbi:uncharacterized protein LOC123682414 [Harmonia axyridis]|uniref:uncharacterized protein LOC123682414 n=1 Tax=Harmonia axyridis TaxID=115357 RepID=UPI001E2789B9|nr:uncharacterized protein LOC123682414 [Harmonia axyridis]